jgi:glyoxylase-like metal-dependent hydrolase (beta-lactamase superfamily II)
MGCAGYRYGRGAHRPRPLTFWRLAKDIELTRKSRNGDYIHHLNCGSLYPVFPRAYAITYCLAVETNQGLALVDTGFGLEDYARPSPLMRLFLFWMGVPRDPSETAARQLFKLGYSPEDVRHIVLTHLHLDHAGGLRDFPGAQVHVSGAEYGAAMDPRGLMERAYDPAHWAHGPRWTLHERFDEDWFGFDAAHVVEDLIPEILLIPLPGHTRGHCGVAVQTRTGWLLQCGDAASPYHRDTDLHGRGKAGQYLNVLPGWFTRRVIGPHVPRLRALVAAHSGEISVISAHDRYSFDRMAAVQ